ncbi:hypothetical protein HDF11_004865 [Tunturiibacter psychrotolerans]|jgi:hypothetical protein
MLEIRARFLCRPLGPDHNPVKRKEQGLLMFVSYW